MEKKRKRERDEGEQKKKKKEDKKPIRIDSRAVSILSQVAIRMSVKRAHEYDTREMVRNKTRERIPIQSNY